MHIEIRQEAFDPWQELAAYRRQRDPELRGRAGANAVFVGNMRDYNEGETVTGMVLEHYPGMTEKHIESICEQAGQRWQLFEVLVLHRVGQVRIDEAIVLVAVWSGHRGDALDACRFIIEDLKARAPFWKKEQLEQGERWVEANTGGYAGKS